MISRLHKHMNHTVQLLVSVTTPHSIHTGAAMCGALLRAKKSTKCRARVIATVAGRKPHLLQRGRDAAGRVGLRVHGGQRAECVGEVRAVRVHRRQDGHLMKPGARSSSHLCPKRDKRGDVSTCGLEAPTPHARHARCRNMPPKDTHHLDAYRYQIQQ